MASRISCCSSCNGAWLRPTNVIATRNSRIHPLSLSLEYRKGGACSFVPNYEMNIRCPQMVISFYETRLRVRCWRAIVSETNHHPTHTLIADSVLCYSSCEREMRERERERETLYLYHSFDCARVSHSISRTFSLAPALNSSPCITYDIMPLRYFGAALIDKSRLLTTSQAALN